MIGGTQRERCDGKGRISGARGGIRARPKHEKVAYVVMYEVRIDDTVLWVTAHDNGTLNMG